MKPLKRIISIAVSLTVLGLIYTQLDTSALLRTIAEVHGPWLALGLFMVIPTTALTAWRLCKLAPPAAGLHLGEATRLTLAASVMNMVFPSKMGDLIKGYFIAQRGALDGPAALSLVVFEKSCDMLALMVWCALGLVMLPNQHWMFWPLTGAVVAGVIVGSSLLASSRAANLFFALAGRAAPGPLRARLDDLHRAWLDMLRSAWSDRRRAWGVALMSVFLWFVHLLQIWIFMLSLGAQAPFVQSLGLTPLAILAGLVPMTFAGVGTRDAALIFFYRDYFAAAVGAALGILCTLRYVIPALAGLPFFGQYVYMAQEGERLRSSS